MRKSILKGLSLLILLATLTACSDTSSSQNDDGTLQVYSYANDNKTAVYIREFNEKFPHIEVELTEFETVEEMDDTLQFELNSTSKADVIIFPYDTGLNVYELGKSDVLMDLSQYIAKDKTIIYDNYMDKTFEVGGIGDKNYILPLTFTLSLVMYDSDQSAINEEIINFTDLNEMITQETEKMADEDFYGASFYSNLFKSIATFSNLFVLDENYNVSYDRDYLKEIITFTKNNAVDEMDKINEIINSYGGSVRGFDRFSYAVFDYKDVLQDVYINTAYYQANGIENPSFSAISDENNNLIAMANSYAVATKNAPSYAYDFIKTAMNSNPMSTFQEFYYLSPNTANVLLQLNEYYLSTKFNQTIDGINVNFNGLGLDLTERLSSIINSIDEIIITNNQFYNELLIDTFMPYFNDEKSYDECYAEFENKTNLYLAE